MEEEAKEPYSEEKAEALRARLLSLAQPTTTTTNNSRPPSEEPAVQVNGVVTNGDEDGRSSNGGVIAAVRMSQAMSTLHVEERSRAVAEARRVANETAIAAARQQLQASSTNAMQLPVAVERAQPMSADYLESIMASQLADAAADAAAAAVEQEAAAEDEEDPASLHDDQMVDISDTTIVSNQAAPPPPLPPRLELPKLKPGETVWIPSRKCVATVQANNPFFKVMHCALEDGSSLELPYAELQAQAASNGNATEHSHALSSAIAGLESQVHFLARELERAPDAAQRAEAIADEEPALQVAPSSLQLFSRSPPMPAARTRVARRPII